MAAEFYSPKKFSDYFLKQIREKQSSITPQIGGITSSQQENVITPVATVGDNTSTPLPQAVKLTSNAEASRMMVKAKLKDKAKKRRRIVKNRRMVKKRSVKKRQQKKKKKVKGGRKTGQGRRYNSRKRADIFMM